MNHKKCIRKITYFLLTLSGCQKHKYWNHFISGSCGTQKQDKIIINELYYSYSYYIQNAFKSLKAVVFRVWPWIQKR